MGGFGSGSWKKPNSKSTIEGKHRLDIRRLKKMGCLQSGHIDLLAWSRYGKPTALLYFKLEADRMGIVYCYRCLGGEWGHVVQFIYLDQTPCNYGGHRTWFLCPKCLRRVAVLYRAGKYFWCRHCHRLTYSSQKKDRMSCLSKKASKIRMRLGGNGSLLDPFPDKPKNMHWKTYWQLRKESEQAHELFLFMAGQQIRSLTKNLKKVKLPSSNIQVEKAFSSSERG